MFMLIRLLPQISLPSRRSPIRPTGISRRRATTSGCELVELRRDWAREYARFHDEQGNLISVPLAWTNYLRGSASRRQGLVRRQVRRMRGVRG